MTTKHFIPVMVTFILLALGLYGYQHQASSGLFVIDSLKVTFLMAVNLMLQIYTFKFVTKNSWTI